MTTATLADALGELKTALGAKVTQNDTIREHHSKDESFHLASMPDAVVFAESIDDIATTLRICHAHRVPVTPFGAGTSLEANSTPIHGGVSLDVSRMDAVVRVGSSDLDLSLIHI